MKRVHLAMPRITAVLAMLVAAATAVPAAEPGPACAPVLKAMTRTLETDHATVSTSNGETNNGITAGGVNYLQVGGAWRMSGLPPRDNQQRFAQNLRNAKFFTCQPLPDSTLEGAPVFSYRTITETDDAVTESTVSLLKSSGLAVAVENTTTERNGPKSHYVTKYSYTGIRAPTIQK
jgi:hypothetical protein